MVQTEFYGQIISDFNIETFIGYLNNDDQAPKVKVSGAPYGQVVQTLVEVNESDQHRDLDFVLVWTQPHRVIAAFNNVLNFEPVELSDLLSQVDAYAELLRQLGERLGALFVPAWVWPSFDRGLGMLDMREGLGRARLLLCMNLRLTEKLSAASNIYVLDAQRWVTQAGAQAFNPKYWYMAKVAFGNSVFKEAVRDLKAALLGLAGKTRKLILVDLDNTLWGGVIGDDGIDGICLGGHDPAGEAFVDFQKALKALTNRGIILGIVSKNEEALALKAITRHPEMVLRAEDFAGWRINWDDKAKNIAELVSELNLGLDAAVFIDDNQVERARVRDALPDVLVPDWPQSEMLYTQALSGLRCFDAPSISDEDLRRVRMYAADRTRNQVRVEISSLDEWLATLETRLHVDELTGFNISRATQLLNKTNQMNLSTRRMSEKNLSDWVKQDGRKLWTIRVADRFGDLGLCGLVSLEINGRTARIVDFLLSCRVMGRKIEEAMLAVAVDYARIQNLDKACAQFLPTEKNAPCLRFWQASGFIYNQEDDLFCWSMQNQYPFPKQISIER